MSAVVAVGSGLASVEAAESDAALVLRYRSGDMRAIETLLSRHSNALYRLCRSLVRDEYDADDVFQEAQARAVSCIDGLREPGMFKSWLFSIARNCARDGYRRQRHLCPMPTEDHEPAVLWSDSPQDDVERIEEHELVARALSRLNKNHQTVLMLRDVQGLSYKEIASRLAVSHSAVETLLFRARHSLRREYARAAG